MWRRGIVLAALLLCAVEAQAQDAAVPVQVCGTPPRTFPLGTPAPLTMTQQGALCISGSISATTAQQIANSVTFSANNFGNGTSQNIFGNTFGALYTQPTFAGTPVDATHGFPVNIVAGGGAGGTSSTFGAAFPAAGTAAGMSQGGNMVALTGTSNNLNVNLAGNSFGALTVSGTVTANAGTNLNTSALALDTSVNGLLLSQGSTTAAQKGPLIQGAVTTGAPTYTTAQTSPISLDTSGNVRVTAAGIAQGSTTSGETGSLVMGAVTTAAPTYTTAQSSPLSLTTGGLLRVDGSGVTQPVSGTVTANAGSGTFTISGTVTANAGANLNTSLLALDSSVNGILLGQGSTTSGQKGPLIQAAVTTSAPSYTTAQSSPLSLTTAGALRTDASATTQPVSGTVTATQGNAGSNGQAWWAQLGDTTTGPVVVQPASTTPAAADKALTVAFSPNSIGCVGQSLANTKIKPISITAATAIIAGVAAKKIYICSIDLVVGAADNVALVEGTTTTTPCDTGTAGMAGGTTAATGWNFAANGGLTKGNGVGLLYITATAADNVCLLVSSAAQVSGAVTYAQF